MNICRLSVTNRREGNIRKFIGSARTSMECMEIKEALHKYVSVPL
jgi:hypothetical protein